MTKIKHLLLLICIAGCFTACKKDKELTAKEQFTADTTAIRKFVNENNIKAIKDPSGIFYEVIQPGTGSVKYTNSTPLTAEYEGKLLNGTVFDKTTTKPFSFTLGGVIEGWGIGIVKIQKGGVIRLIIPSYLGYGNRKGMPIPPNSVLDFKITLTDVN